MNVIILATQRSGSTLLCAELQGIGGMGRPGEHFWSWLREAGEAPCLDDAAMDRIAAFGRAEDGSLGFKIMADYLPRLAEARFGPVADRVEGSVRFLTELEAREGPFAWFRIDRADVFDQALSRYLATQTGLYFRTETGTVAAEGHPGAEKSEDTLLAEFRPDRLARHIREIDAERRTLDRIADTLGRSVHLVPYEDLVDRRAEVLAGCCAHASRPVPAEWPERWMKKVVDADLRQRFRRLFDAAAGPVAVNG
ncbi:MAG: Stf0 family sulfotransferase [Paracoccaceae bacterium]